ncbi:unnamed protein product [marine sediment metagenome]|uniref:Uncharacterized protein n=1 Tax=marine sediment metagenome TaxID=412755 RepID=X0VWG2_9ZZZZ
MKTSNLTESVKLARMFILKVRNLEKRVRDNEPESLNDFWMSHCKENSAVKRSSMDLTRSLSKLRNE